MSIPPSKRKGSQTSSSRCDSGTPSKRHASGPCTRNGTSGVSSSRQRSDTPSPDVTKFWPNFKAEACFNCSFQSRHVFISRGVMLNELRETLIYMYFNKWVWDRLAMTEGAVCLELVWEFYVNIHAKDKEGGTLKSYVQGVFLDFLFLIFVSSTTLNPSTLRLLDSHILRLPLVLP